MKKLNTYVCFFAATIFTFTSGCISIFGNGLGEATVTVRVVDDLGEPINEVRSRLLSLSWYNAPWGRTDTNGIFIIHLKDIYAEIGGYFEKQGYYGSKGKIWEWNDVDGRVPPVKTNFTVVLKRMIEAVPMKKREIIVYSPRLNEPIGFDLEIGDWVFPDGKGIIKDILFTMNTNYVLEHHEFLYHLSAEFPGEHNGIQSFLFPVYGNVSGHCMQSDLPPPPIAPETGYDKMYEFFIQQPSSTKRISSFVERRKWIFRTRTEVDDDGKIIAANYGWAVKDITISGKPDGSIGFWIIYYYNPDPHSRSLEPEEIADRQNKISPFEGK